MPNVNLTMPTDYSVELEGIRRRRKLAQMMQAQSLEPVDFPQASGGWAVPMSWTQGLAKMAEGAVGGMASKKATEREKALARMMRENTSAELSQFERTRSGTPAVPGVESVAFEGGRGPETPAVPGNPNAAYEGLARSQNPMLQQAALARMLKGDEDYTLAPDARRIQGGTNKVLATGAPRTVAPPRPLLPSQRIRSRIVGDQEIQEELQDDGTWKQIGTGPRFSRQVTPVDRQKLKPGERFTAEGNVEAIPGSSEYIRQSGLHSKDYQAMLTIQTTNNNATKKIAEILDEKNKGDFNSNFGGWNALVSQYMPGAQDMRKKIESLKSDLKAAGLSIIRSGGGIGTMTEKEWPIVEQMIDSISPLLDEATARNRISGVKAYLDKLSTNASEVYNNEWGQTQFSKGNKSGPRVVDW